METGACNVEIGEEIGGMRRDWGETGGMRTDRGGGWWDEERLRRDWR